MGFRAGNDVCTRGAAAPCLGSVSSLAARQQPSLSANRLSCSNHSQCMLLLRHRICTILHVPNLSRASIAVSPSKETLPACLHLQAADKHPRSHARLRALSGLQEKPVRWRPNYRNRQGCQAGSTRPGAAGLSRHWGGSSRAFLATIWHQLSFWQTLHSYPAAVWCHLRRRVHTKYTLRLLMA